MKIREMVKAGAEELKTAGIDDCRFEAEYMLSAVLGWERIKILTEGETEAGAETEKRFFDMIDRRAKKEPAAYIVGHREFMGLDFETPKGVLIPRPDTETVVEEIISKAKTENFRTAVEIGAGSGCISVSIAKYAGIDCTATDINPAAVDVSKRNAEKNGVGDRTTFILGSLFDGVHEKKYDLIVSNPPYIRKADMAALMTDVRDYEPAEALCGGEDGLDFYRRIAAEGRKYLRDGGMIFFEIGYDEAAEVGDILAANGFSGIETVKDLSGLDRVVSARRRDNDV